MNVQIILVQIMFVQTMLHDCAEIRFNYTYLFIYLFIVHIYVLYTKYCCRMVYVKHCTSNTVYTYTMCVKYKLMAYANCTLNNVYMYSLYVKYKLTAYTYCTPFTLIDRKCNELETHYSSNNNDRSKPKVITFVFVYSRVIGAFQSGTSYLVIKRGRYFAVIGGPWIMGGRRIFIGGRHSGSCRLSSMLLATHRHVIGCHWGGGCCLFHQQSLPRRPPIRGGLFNKFTTSKDITHPDIYFRV